MALETRALRGLYRRRARHYDVTANLYYAIGFRQQAYRRRAVAALELRPGDTVVELCCGTGLNLPLLVDAVGANGKVIGVDLTAAMLEQAAGRIARGGWSNVELVHSDAASYEIPAGVAGVVCTFALTFVPEYPAIIARAREALEPGRPLVVLDFKSPERAPRLLVWLGVAITRPFGVTLDLADRRPWEAMRTAFGTVDIQELYFGFAYVARSSTPTPQHRPPGDEPLL